MKDNNADLGNQVIEGTSPPIELEAEYVMPDGTTRPISTPAAEPEQTDLDAQLNAMLNDDGVLNAQDPVEPIILSGDDTVFAPPPPVVETEPAAAEPTPDLDAQLEQLLNDNAEPPVTETSEPIILTPPVDETPIAEPTVTEDPIIVAPPPAEDPIIMGEPTEPVVTAPPPAEQPAEQAQSEQSDVPTAAQLDAELEALLNDKPLETETEQDLDAKLDEMMNLPPDDEQKPAEAVQAVEPQPEPQSSAEPATEPAQAQPSAEAAEARRMMEEARAMMEQVKLAQEQAKLAQEQAEWKAQQAKFAQEQAEAARQQAQFQAQQQATQQQQPIQQPSTAENATLETAREMMRQAQLMMQQARQPQTNGIQTAPTENNGAQAALEMIRQAQLMMQQAQQAQFQAQQQAQQAQFNAALQAQQPVASAMPITDPYAVKEVDRLKNELDGMRELVNKLTFTIAQNPNAAAAQQQQQFQQFMQQPRNDGEREQYKKLEGELERMRREIIEKDLRDREKELDRRQKEAENSVKDIRPEMVQMSDSRDIAPVTNGGIPAGSEFIPLANGVFYSIKDKQVYVMTPASNAAAARPTIEPPHKAAPAKKKAAPARPAARRRPAPRRPGSPAGRRRPMGRPRPHR